MCVSFLPVDQVQQAGLPYILPVIVFVCTT